jgi:hypothetical protein
MLKLLVLVLALATSSAHAGPVCGGRTTFAPATGLTLPVAPLIAQHVEDHYRGGRGRTHTAYVDALHATIDGKRVPITTTDVRRVDGVTRLIKIQSRAVGKLELWIQDRTSPRMIKQASYMIV